MMTVPPALRCHAGCGSIKVWLPIGSGMRGTGIPIAPTDSVNGHGKLRAAK
jgi:hypothetical protein